MIDFPRAFYHRRKNSNTIIRLQCSYGVAHILLRSVANNKTELYFVQHCLHQKTSQTVPVTKLQTQNAIIGTWNLNKYLIIWIFIISYYKTNQTSERDPVTKFPIWD